MEIGEQVIGYHEHMTDEKLCMLQWDRRINGRNYSFSMLKNPRRTSVLVTHNNEQVHFFHKEGVI